MRGGASESHDTLEYSGEEWLKVTARFSVEALRTQTGKKKLQSKENVDGGGRSGQSLSCKDNKCDCPVPRSFSANTWDKTGNTGGSRLEH